MHTVIKCHMPETICVHESYPKHNIASEAGWNIGQRDLFCTKGEVIIRMLSLHQVSRVRGKKERI